jgi:hypothetical protein
MSRSIHHKEKTRKKAKGSSKEPLLHCPVCLKTRKISEARKLLSLEKTYNRKHVDPYSKEPPPDGWALRGVSIGRLMWACDKCLSSGQAIPAKPWLQMGSMDMPLFAYADKLLQCKDCGIDFVFSANEQQYWYETLQFIRDSHPKQRPQCRRKRRIYKRHFHDLQRALEEIDPQSLVQLTQVGELYLKIGNHFKAIEFFRRAKNKGRDQKDKDELMLRLQSIQNELAAIDHPVTS